MADLFQSGALANDDEEKKRLAESQSGQLTGSTGTSGVVSGGTQGSGTAPVGAGGAGGWTNIQSYLDANKGDTGTATNLQQKVGGILDKEKTDLTNSSSAALSGSNQQLEQQKQAKENAGQWINQAAQGYNWNNANENKNNVDVTKISSALNGQYSGPKNYQYNIGDQTRQYGEGLQGGEGYKGLLNKLYTERAGGALSSGQNSLQQQFDVNNQGLEDTRQNLLKQYAGLGTLKDNTLTSTNQGLQKAEQDYRVNQNALKDNLANLENTYRGDVDSNLDVSKRHQDFRDSQLDFSNPNSFGIDDLSKYGVTMSPDNKSGNIGGLKFNSINDIYRQISQDGTPDGELWNHNGNVTRNDPNAVAINNFRNAINKSEDLRNVKTLNDSKARFNIIEQLLGKTPSKSEGITAEERKALPYKKHGWNDAFSLDKTYGDYLGQLPGGK